jgi:septal ring factor EnvC (AmiA/AmiB activator)
MSSLIKELEATLEVATDAVEGNDEYTAVFMKLHDIGETCSVENYVVMKTAVHLVNTYSKDFPSDMKTNLDVYTYRLLKSMQQPISSTSTVHHYYHEQKEGQDLFSMVKDMHKDIKTIKNKITITIQNNSEEQLKDIDTVTKNNEREQQQSEQQGNSTVNQKAS